MLFFAFNLGFLLFKIYFRCWPISSTVSCDRIYTAWVESSPWEAVSSRVGRQRCPRAAGLGGSEGHCSTLCRCPRAAPVAAVHGRARLQQDISPWMLVPDSQTALADRWPTAFLQVGLEKPAVWDFLGGVKFWGYFYTFYWKHSISPFLPKKGIVRLNIKLSPTCSSIFLAAVQYPVFEKRTQKTSQYPIRDSHRFVKQEAASLPKVACLVNHTRIGSFSRLI